MKRRLILFAFLLPSLIFAQNYVPLVQNQKHWIYSGCGTQAGGTFLFAYSLENDTVLNGQTYVQLYQRNFQPPEFNNACEPDDPSALQPPFTLVGETFLGGLREDLDERRVYFQPASGSDYWQQTCFPDEESVLFDFGGEVGDTLFSCATRIHNEFGQNFNTDSIVRVGITTDIVFRGIATNQHDFIIVDEYHGPPLYEGVGMYYGLWLGWQNFIFLAEGYFGLRNLCFGTADECLYPEPSSTRNLWSDDAVQMLPSPNDGRFQLQFAAVSTGSLTLRITDATGRLVHQSNPAGTAAEVEISNAAAGLYFVTIWDEEGLRWRGWTVVR